MNRRSFMASILAAACAPAAIGSGILMPVKKIATPFEEGFWTPSLCILTPDDYEEGVMSNLYTKGRYTRIGNIVSFTAEIRVPGQAKHHLSEVISSSEFDFRFPHQHLGG